MSSKAFYDAGEFARCEDQCRRGLEIDDDPTLQLTLGFVLMRQADERKLAEAVAVFESMSADDWRVDLGLGMALQQLARLEAARAADANQRLSAGQRADLAAAEAEHRADARDALERAAVAAGENAPADVSFHLALLDLEEKKHDEFVVHAEDAFARLAEAEKVARAQLAQPMAQMMRERTLADSAMAAERGQRLCRELAILSWNRGDFSQASAAMTRLEQFGSLDRADYFSRGAVREKLGDDEKAVLDYEKFIELSSGVFDETVGKAVTALTRVRARLAEKRTATPAGGS
ncbi:MAG: hypothetical protein FJ293_01820 [Planctomycetes bacterium]|nr:hypothetical protein [Planctomycetota bacterium]